jgi:hypothetical protein
VLTVRRAWDIVRHLPLILDLFRIRPTSMSVTPCSYALARRLAALGWLS